MMMRSLIGQLNRFPVQRHQEVPWNHSATMGLETCGQECFSGYRYVVVLEPSGCSALPCGHFNLNSAHTGSVFCEH